MKDILHRFFAQENIQCGQIYNERSLQLELGFFLRSHNCGQIEFERSFEVSTIDGATRKSKRNLDILINDGHHTTAVELKVPLAGRVPETMYDFCADISFIEAILRAGKAQSGYCIMVTSDPLYWRKSGSTGSIYDYFRSSGISLTGCINKPTGSKDTSVVLTGRYDLESAWSALSNMRLMNSGHYLLVEVSPG